MRPGVAVAFPVIALLSTACSGCGGAKDEKTCASEVAELDQWLTEQAKIPAGHDLTSEMPSDFLPATLDDPGDEGIEMPMVVAGVGALFVDGAPVGSLRAGVPPDELTELLIRKKELWSSFHPGVEFPGVIGLALDKRLSFGVVVTLARAVAGTGFPHVYFVYRAETAGAPLPGPPPSSIDDEVKQLTDPKRFDPSEKAPLLDDSRPTLPDRVFKSCKAVHEALAPLSQRGLDPTEKFAAMREAVKSGLLQCGCNVEMNAVKRLFWLWAGRDESTTTTPWYVTRLDVRPGADSLSKPGATPWSEALKDVRAASKKGTPVSLEAR